MNAPETNPEILVVDDEVQIRRLLRGLLTAAGYQVREAGDGGSGLDAVAAKRPDAIILDLGLPDCPGLEVLQRLREWSQVPVMILSVRAHEQDKISVLDAGANDYLTKPFSGGELLARLRVLLRRPAGPVENEIVQFGPIAVNLNRRVVTKGGQDVMLTAREYALLRLLIAHRNRVITHRQILRELWGTKCENQTHYVRVYMARLREKLEAEPHQPRFLITESGSGYRLDVA